MAAVQILAIGLLIHEVLKYCIEGRVYFVGTFCPTFGLRLTPQAAAASHAALAVICAALVLRPGWFLLYPALLAAVTLIVASYPLRLSNHLVVAWFLGAIFCLDSVFAGAAERGVALSSFARQSALMLLVLTYALAAFHKVNREYLSVRTSCAARYCDLYLRDRGLTHPLLRRFGAPSSIIGVLAAELSVLLLLLTPHTFAFAFALAALLHFLFGLLCFQHFSTVMYAVWLAAAPPPAASALPIPLIALGSIVGAAFGAVSGYRHQRLARIVHVVFGGLAMFVFNEAVRGFAPSGSLSFDLPEEPAQAIALILLALTYFINGAGPYLGLKIEFSLAMFSNLRHAPWSHLCFRQAWRPLDLAKYVAVHRVEGLTPLDDCPLQHRVAAQWLREHERWYFSAYFLEECLRAFPSVRLSCTKDGPPLADPPRRVLRMNLYPFALPRDPSVPHCK